MPSKEYSKRLVSSFEYGCSFYRSKSLRMFARAFLRKLPSGVTLLVSMGSSGHAIASAMISLSKRNLSHAHIRKPAEDSHDTTTLFRKLEGHRKIAIVDDFICSGNTVSRILRIIHRSMGGVKMSWYGKEGPSFYVIVVHGYFPVGVKYESMIKKTITLEGLNEQEEVH